MAQRNFFVGDIQGCFIELKQLLNHVNFNPKQDRLWACGDLISRGPDSLATLRFFKQLGDSGRVVLGNHDLHLFCVAAGLKRGSKKDKQQELLAAEDLPELLDWLRHQPLMYFVREHELLLSHAGFPPHWDLETALARTEEAAEVLQSDNYLEFCQQMYGVYPDRDDPNADLYERVTYTVNALTRMRFLTPEGYLEFADKTAPADVADNDGSQNQPWFAAKQHTLLSQYRLVFGHWAALLGKTNHPNAIGLDLGCCWDGHLCLWQAETGSRYLAAAGGDQPVIEQQA